jgi:hypothetical protein
MKRFKPLSAILLVLLVCCTLNGSAVAQAEADTTQISSERPTIAFGGARWFEGETVVSYGVGRQLSDHLWLFTLNDYGVYTSAGVELCYMFQVLPALSLGIIAGPNVDIVPVQTEPDPVAYLMGAGGGLASYEIAESGGVWAYWKRKFKMGEQEEYLYKNQFGAGIYVKIGL